MVISQAFALLRTLPRAVGSKAARQSQWPPRQQFAAKQPSQSRKNHKLRWTIVIGRSPPPPLFDPSQRWDTDAGGGYRHPCKVRRIAVHIIEESGYVVHP
jgi:hypothetical protein